MTIDDNTAAAIVSLHEAYEMVRVADMGTGQRFAGLLGPIMDLLANTADMIEETPGPVAE